MPPTHVQLCIGNPRSQVLRPHSLLRTVEIGGLWVVPQVTTMKPLVAVVVHLGTEGHAGREGAVTQCGERANPRDLVNVANEKYIALARSLRSRQRKHNLVEKCIAGEAFVLPGIIFWYLFKTGVVENSMNYFVLKVGELRQFVLQIQGFWSHLKSRGYTKLQHQHGYNRVIYYE